MDKGTGEIGSTGTAAAIGNAVGQAAGRRVRDLREPWPGRGADGSGA